MTTNPLLAVTDLSLELSGKALLNKVSFQLELGDRLLLKGKNGTGKTSLLKSLAGVLSSYDGVVELNNQNIKALEPKQHASFLAYVPQALDFKFPITVSRFFELSLSQLSNFEDSDWHSRLFSLCLISPLLSKLLPNLSQGEKRRVAFVAALLGSPKVILLDETSSALDDHNLTNLQEALTAYCTATPCAIIEVSHESRTICQNFNKTLNLSDQQVFEAYSCDQAL
jgi:ABC-type Mn2+/Zn2+ transport system ATPase subunit